MAKKRNRKKIACYILAFVIPVIMMLIISFLYGFYPFGNTSVLIADMRYQFVDYFGYLKYIFFGNDTFAYNFSKTFGGDMLGFSAYYLNSLPNLILLLFPNEYLPAGILLMATLLIGASGLTFNILLDKLFSTRWASLIFSTAYAFMGFMLAYFNCVHYFFSIMLLPLIILGLCNMIETGKISILYIITLFLSIFSNYYMGYMTCLFSVIFFFYYIFTQAEMIKLSAFKNAFFSYVVASCTAAVMSAFTLIPVLFSLVGQKSGVGEADLSLSKNFNMIDVFSGLYTTAFHGNISDGLPIIYCGVTTVVLAILFLVNKKITRRERIVSTLALAAVLACFYINALNIIWHGFNAPIGFPYRDSFFFSFLLLFIAYKGFISTANGLGLYQGVTCVLVFVVYSVYMLVSKNEYVGRNQIVLTGTILVVVLFFLYGFRNKKEYVIPLIAGLFLLQGGDLLYNGYISIGGYFPDLNENPQAYSFDEYYEFVTQNRDIIETIEEKDPGFYRIEKMYRRSLNDAMLLGYNGLSHFSSCETEQVKTFMETLGFRNNKNWAYYGHGSTTFADCFMGVKYLLSQYDETAKPYEQQDEIYEKYIYHNPYAMPVAFGMRPSVRKLAPEKYNMFTYQNAIATTFTGKKYQIYRPVYVSKIEMVNAEQDGNSYRRIDENEEAYVSYHLIANNNDFIYMYFYAPDLQDVKIVIDDLEKEPYFTPYGWSIREVGHFERGDEIEVRLYLEQDEIKIGKELFYYENKDELSRWYEDSKNAGVQLTKITSSHLSGEIDFAEDRMLVMTIPYETSWKIKIDGKEVKQEKVMKGLMAVPVYAGKHTIDMRYIPKGLIEGSILSLIAFVFMIVLAVFNRKKEKIPTTR
ncbi:MAG: YfhO family protein [Lachnospiraceae bacterium]|nr:YfhO family protein [Lachnospiraceae bacterium]